MNGLRRSTGDANKINRERALAEEKFQTNRDPASDFDVIGLETEPGEESRVTSLCRLMRGSLSIEVKQPEPKKVRKQSIVELETDRRRSGKWIYMIRKLKLGEKVSRSDLKRRARKGIPDSVRGSAWPILVQSDR